MEKNIVEAYRREFPVTDKYIYLDHAGVAPIPLRERSAVEAFLSQAAEGGAFYYPKWAQRVADIRKSCAKLLRAELDEIAFIKSTSHGLSIVAEGLDWREGDNVLIYEKEFPSNLYPWMNLERKGVGVKIIPSRDGRIMIDSIAQLIDSRTRLLAISSVQFSNGFRIDLEQVGALCKQKNILLCVDAIQSLGIIPMDVKKYHIDFLSADAHKWLLGPEGIGIFYCRSEHIEKMRPPLVGWKCVQNELDFDHPHFLFKTNALKFEEGSMNLIGIIGLGAALDLLFEIGIENIEERVLDLGDLIVQEAKKRDYVVVTPNSRKERGGSITFTGQFHLLQIWEGLRNRKAMINVRGGGLRISPHFYNTEREIMAVFNLIDQVIISD